MEFETFYCQQYNRFLESNNFILSNALLCFMCTCIFLCLKVKCMYVCMYVCMRVCVCVCVRVSPLCVYFSRLDVKPFCRAT